MSSIGTDAAYETAAQRTLDALDRLYNATLVAFALTPEMIANYVSPGTVGVWDWLTNDNADSRLANAAANLKRDSGYIEDLRGRRRRWAEAGQRDDGTPSSWEAWRDFANVVGNDIAAQGVGAWDGDIFGGLVPNVPEVGFEVGAWAAETYDKLKPSLDKYGTMLVVAAVVLGTIYLFGPAIRNIGGKVTE